MADITTKTEEQNAVDYSFKGFFRDLAAKRGNEITPDALYSAFTRTRLFNSYTDNPFIQNARVKKISSLPIDYSKNEIAEFIKKPDNSEQPLRQVGHALEVAAYPYYKVRKTYQDILTYHYYNSPAYLEEADGKRPELFREWRLTDKYCQKLGVKEKAHEITGQALQEGKVFYTLRHSVDKAHNKVDYAFMQQLPSDWTKIVGFNNISGYTVAFNMMYFLQPGAVWTQFGDLFEAYIADFGLVAPAMKKSKETVYASVEPFKRLDELRSNAGGELAGAPEVYSQGGVWFYWITLPADAVWTFEIDDVNRNVISPFTGLMLSMAQIAQYESIQLELVQNPLISVLTGEIPYRDEKNSTADDDYKLSIPGRELFLTFWNELCAAYNTGGVGAYFAPVENMKLQTLAEAPGATEISSNGYAYAMQKSGLSALVPVSDDTRAGTAQLSAKLEGQFAKGIYAQFERMINHAYSSLNLRFEWTFKMFGDIYSDGEALDAAKEGLTLGILSDTLTYLALRDRSLTDDLSVSRAMVGSGIMDLRLPLISSYSAKNENGLPPQKQGRPESEEITSEGNEGDADSPVERNL